MKKSVNTIDEISKEINDITKKAAADIAAENEILNNIDSDIARLEEEKSEAVRNGDNSKYKDIKSQIDDLHFQRQYHKERIRTFSEQPLISEQQYEKYVSDIMLQLRKESDEGIVETLNFLQRERNKAEELNAKINDANKLLRNIQRNVFKEDIHQKDPDGNDKKSKLTDRPIIDKAKIKSFTDYDFSHWIFEITYQPGRKDSCRMNDMRVKVEGR